MKKRPPPRPRKPKRRPAAVDAKAKVEVGDLSSSIRKGSVGSSCTSNASVEPATGQVAETKSIELADRVDNVAPMTNARGWKIFVGIIISWLLVATGVVLFANYGT